VQDTEILLALAGIAGVFVGFGALISATSGLPGELWTIRSVVEQGIIVIAAALVPVVIERYDVAARDLWVMASVAILALEWAAILMAHVRQEDMAFRVFRTRAGRAMLAFVVLFLEVPAQVALFMVVLGFVTGQEAALYVTAVVLWLFQPAVLLVSLVFRHRETAAA
jgi:hypothetical protein